MFSRCFLDFSVSVGVFVIGLSQISSFFSLHIQIEDVKREKKTPIDLRVKILKIKTLIYSHDFVHT